MEEIEEYQVILSKQIATSHRVAYKQQKSIFQPKQFVKIHVIVKHQIQTQLNFTRIDDGKSTHLIQQIMRLVLVVKKKLETLKQASQQG